MIDGMRIGLLLSSDAIARLEAGASRLRTPRSTNIRGTFGLVARVSQELVGIADLENCAAEQSEEGTAYLWSLTAIRRFPPQQIEVRGGPVWTRIAGVRALSSEPLAATDDIPEPVIESDLQASTVQMNLAVAPEIGKKLGDFRVFRAALRPPESFRYSPIHDFWKELTKVGPITTDAFFEHLISVGWRRPSGKPFTRAIVRTDLVSMVKNGFATIDPEGSAVPRSNSPQPGLATLQSHSPSISHAPARAELISWSTEKRLFAAAVDQSTTWARLRKALQKDNLDIVPRGGGIAIIRADSKDYICKASEAGFGYARLIEKFGEGLLGHSHGWLADRTLNKN